MFSLVPEAESKLRCTTMPPVHVLYNFAMTSKVQLSDLKICLEVRIDELSTTIVGRKVK